MTAYRTFEKQTPDTVNLATGLHRMDESGVADPDKGKANVYVVLFRHDIHHTPRYCFPDICHYCRLFADYVAGQDRTQKA